MAMKTTTMSDQLIAEFTQNYMEKVFYFCLKKTGNPHEAEDLASDITLNILASLKKGTIPASFSAWVWQIARNRYSVWADRKNKKNDSFSGADIGDFEIEDEASALESAVIHSEELSLLRRELAFISADYRDIVVAYYIEDKKTKDIAANLSIPEGTVKTKLFRARNILKEGMNMAREFGIKSYKPENVIFTASGSMDKGSPHNAVQRMIPKNILLEASGNPSTLEELSIELGIAMPYMEEEVTLLEKRTLLKKLDNGKYITNFFIADKETQFSVYMAMRNQSKQRSEMLDAIVSDTLADIRELGVANDSISNDNMKWWLLIHAVDYFSRAKIGAVNIGKPPKRENGEGWGFVGYEECKLPEKLFVGQDGNGSGKIVFWAYDIDEYGLSDRKIEIYYEDVLFFGEAVANNRKTADFSESEMRIWNRINGKVAHADENGNIIPDVLVLTAKNRAALHALWEAHPLAEKLIESMKTVYREIIEILKKNTNPVLHEQLEYYAAMDITNMRMMTIHDEVDTGKLIVPEDSKTSTIAMALYID